MAKLIPCGSSLFLNDNCKDIDYVIYNFDSRNPIDITVHNISWNDLQRILTFQELNNRDALFNYQLDSFYQKQNVFGFQYNILDYRENAIKYLKFRARYDDCFKINLNLKFKYIYHYYLNFIIFKNSNLSLSNDVLDIAKKYHDRNYDILEAKMLYNNILALN